MKDQNNNWSNAIFRSGVYFCFILGVQQECLAQHNSAPVQVVHIGPFLHEHHNVNNNAHNAAVSNAAALGAAGHHHLNSFSVEFNSQKVFANYFGLVPVAGSAKPPAGGQGAGPVTNQVVQGANSGAVNTGSNSSTSAISKIELGAGTNVSLNNSLHLNSAVNGSNRSHNHWQVNSSAMQTSTGAMGQTNGYKHEGHALALLGQARMELNGRDLDLSLTSKVLTWRGQTETIAEGNTTKTLTYGEAITPAELQAGLEKVDGTGVQTLVIGGNGAAVGGSLEITASMKPYFDVQLPVGVTLDVKGATTNNPLIIAGRGRVDGTIDFLTGKGNAVSDLLMSNLVVDASGKIVDAGILDLSVKSTFTNDGMITAANGLNLASLGNFNNTGSIASNGAINITSAGSVNNVSSAGAATANITGSSVNLLSQTGNFTNSGHITASTGNVAFSSPSTAALNLNNTGGQVIANKGEIDFTNPITNSSQTLSLVGGDYLALNAVNINAGNGEAYVNVNNITAPLNVSASSAHVTAATSDLILGKQCVTGDPTYYNTAGDVVFSNDISTNGANLAVVASQSIRGLNSSATDVTLDSGGGAITLIAGFAFTSSSGLSSGNPGGSSEVLTITGASTTGGGIYALNLISHGGNILAAANSGPPTSNFGTMQLGNINSGATGSGVNGNVTLIAGGPNAGAIAISNIITAGGTGGGGNVVITTAQPAISGNGTMTINGSGNITSGNTIIGTTPGASASVSLGNIGTIINIAGNLNFNTTSVYLFNNANIAGNLNINPNNTTTNISYISFDNPGNGLQCVFNVGGSINVATANNLNSLNTVFFEGDSNVVNGTVNVTGGIGSLPNSVAWFTGFAGGISLGNIKAGIVNFDGQGTVNISGTVQATANHLDAVHIGNAGSNLAITVNGTITSASGVSIQGSSLTIGNTGSITSSAGSSVYIASQASNVPMVVTLSGTNSSITALGGGSIIFGYAIYDGPFYPNYNPTLTQYSSTINCNSGTGQLSASSINFNVGNSYNVTLNSGVLSGTLTGSASAINLRANNSSVTLGSISATNLTLVAAGGVTVTDNVGGSNCTSINITTQGAGSITNAGAGTYALEANSVTLTSTSGNIGAIRVDCTTFAGNTTGNLRVNDLAVSTVTLNASSAGSGSSNTFTFVTESNIVINGNVGGYTTVVETLAGNNGSVTINPTANVGLWLPGQQNTTSILAQGTGAIQDGGAGTNVVQGYTVNLSQTASAGAAGIGSPGLREMCYVSQDYSTGNVHINVLGSQAVTFQSVVGGGNFFQVLANGAITVAAGANIYAPNTVLLEILPNGPGSNGNITINGVIGTTASTTQVIAGGSGNIVEGAGGLIQGASVTASTLGGTLGSSGAPLAVSGGSLTLNSGGAMYVSNSYSGNVTLANAVSGTSMSVSSNGPFAISSVTANGNIALVSTSGAMSTTANATISTTSGSIELQNTDTSGGSIALGSGTTIHASSTTAGVGNVDIVIGNVPSNPVVGTAPSNVVVNNTGGGKTYFGSNGITAVGPTNTLNASGRNIVFNTPLTNASIKLDGGVVITADPPVVGVSRTSNNDQIGSVVTAPSVGSNLNYATPGIVLVSGQGMTNTTAGVINTSLQTTNSTTGDSLNFAREAHQKSIVEQ